MLQIVPITPQLASVYKEVRLRALQSDPSAFGSTYARETQFDDAVWLERSSSLNGEERIGFLAMEADSACGLVACFLDEQDATRAQVISMWVVPTHRGTGLSAALIDAIRAWAQLRGCTTLQLMVTSDNNVAMKFYERYGFVRTGRTEPYPNDPRLFEMEMARAIVAK